MQELFFKIHDLLVKCQSFSTIELPLGRVQLKVTEIEILRFASRAFLLRRRILFFNFALSICSLITACWCPFFISCCERLLECLFNSFSVKRIYVIQKAYVLLFLFAAPTSTFFSVFVSCLSMYYLGKPCPFRPFFGYVF